MPLRAASILTTAVLVLSLGAANAQGDSKPPPAQERTLGYYRCGPEGHDLRDAPCPAGEGRTAALPKDTVDPKEADAARKRVATESRDLAAREKEREREAAKAPPRAAGIDGRLQGQRAAKPVKPADPKKPKPKDPKKPPKKKPKVPKSPDPASPPTPKVKAGDA